jgi:hypothetical protein
LPEPHGAAQITTQAGLWWGAGGAAALAVLAVIAEQRRSRRRNLDRPGWVPWTLIQLLAFLAAVVLLALAFTGRTGAA